MEKEKQNVWKITLVISTSLKALRRLPKRLKTLELRRDTHKNSNVPQMLLAFEETV